MAMLPEDNRSPEEAPRRKGDFMWHGRTRNIVLAGIAIGIVVGCGGRNRPPQKSSQVAPRPIQSEAVVVGRAPNACCTDLACDRTEFMRHGGICPGDSRIKGPQVPKVMVAQRH